MTPVDMAAEVRRFNLAVEDFSKQQVPEKVVQGHRYLIRRASDSIISKSPVRTGRFRGNWQTSQGEPAVGEVPAAVAIAGGREGARAQRERVLAVLQPYAQAWIVNNLPYAVPLEEGHSKQAPLGMVGLTVGELRDTIVPDGEPRRGFE